MTIWKPQRGNWHVWILWAAAALVLVSCPMLLSEPAMWVYLLDPELLALVVVVGRQYTRLELGVLRLRFLASCPRFGTFGRALERTTRGVESRLLAVTVSRRDADGAAVRPRRSAPPA